MKTAFLFPGQGAQFVGMGKDIAEQSAVGADVFKRADDVAGFELSRICFEGTEEKLNTTTISQPAIFVTSAAILDVLRTQPATKGIKVDVTAGLSLGEYTALYAAGIIGFEDALRLVLKRGQAMQKAADSTEGSMVSIIGLDNDQVEKICNEARQGELLEAVNFNCPGQIVVSGGKKACSRAADLAEKYGAIKAVELAVAGAFHTEMMVTAAKSLCEALRGCQISEPDETKIIANIDAEYYKSSQSIRNGLIKQLVSPILWQKSMERLLADGVENFYEIGPGRVLTALMKRINRKTRVVNLSSMVSLTKLVNS